MKPKSNSVVTVTQEGDLIHFDVKDAGRVTLDTSKLSDECKAYAMFHGLKQRGSDAAALSRDDVSGKTAPASEKKAAIEKVVNHLMTGTKEWAMTGQGGGGKSITIEAIAAIKGVTYEEAEAFVEKFAKDHLTDGKPTFGGDTKKALAFLREGKRVAEKIDEIRDTRRPAPKVDADNALAELGVEPAAE